MLNSNTKIYGKHIVHVCRKALSTEKGSLISLATDKTGNGNENENEN
jgi:hypothetical protein